MNEVVKRSELSQTTDIKIDTDKAGTFDMVGGAGTGTNASGATGPLTRAISQRRSHRRQWRIFEIVALIVLDAALVDAAFRLAHYLRYTVFFRSSLIATFRNNLMGIESISPHAQKIQDAFTPIG